MKLRVFTITCNSAFNLNTYLDEFETNIENILGGRSGAPIILLAKPVETKESQATLHLPAGKGKDQCLAWRDGPAPDQSRTN
jgi:hypothetical protein